MDIFKSAHRRALILSIHWNTYECPYYIHFEMEILFDFRSIQSISSFFVLFCIPFVCALILYSNGEEMKKKTRNISSISWTYIFCVQYNYIFLGPSDFVVKHNSKEFDIQLRWLVYYSPDVIKCAQLIQPVSESNIQIEENQISRWYVSIISEKSTQKFNYIVHIEHDVLELRCK